MHIRVLRMQERGKIAYDVHMIFIATYTIAIDCLLVTCTLFTMFTRRLLVRSHVTGTGSHDSLAAIADSEKQDGATVIRCS